MSLDYQQMSAKVAPLSLGGLNNPPSLSAPAAASETQEGEGDPYLSRPGPRATDEKSRRLKGLPYAPQHVNCAGGDGVAWVWWKAPPERDPDDLQRDKLFVEPPDTTTYILKRFRRNINTNEWDYKGSTNVGLVSQARVAGLQNGQYYRFSLVAASERGMGPDSAMSEAVKVDTPLPKGWTELWDATSKRAYYKNNATLQVTWERPERLNKLLDVDVYLRFAREEHNAMERFYEKVSQHGRAVVNVDAVMALLHEAGLQGLERYEVMEACLPVLHAAKGVLTYGPFVSCLLCLKEALTLRAALCPRCVRKSPPLRLERLEQDRAFEAAHSRTGWTRYRHPKSKAWFHYNKETKETSWAMPDEIRYHLSDAMLQGIMEACPIALLKEWEKQFANMDLNGSGTIDKEELTLFLRSLSEPAEPKQVQAMFQDYYGKRDWRPEIFFEDFCKIMCELKTGRLPSWKVVQDKYTSLSLSVTWPPEPDYQRHATICLCGCKVSDLNKR